MFVDLSISLCIGHLMHVCLSVCLSNLFHCEDVLVEIKLQTLISVVDTQLLKTVRFEILQGTKTKLHSKLKKIMSAALITLVQTSAYNFILSTATNVLQIQRCLV